MKEVSGGEVAVHKTYRKGDKLRMDDGDSGFLVWDAKKKEGFSVNLEERTYMMMPWKAAKPDEVNGLLDNMVVTRTGKSDKVAGYA